MALVRTTTALEEKGRVVALRWRGGKKKVLLPSSWVELKDGRNVSAVRAIIIRLETNVTSRGGSGGKGRGSRKERGGNMDRPAKTMMIYLSLLGGVCFSIFVFGYHLSSVCLS
jgi:hypothetical protein